MKNNYNIIENPPELSAEQISKHQDFDALFAQFEATTEPPADELTTSETPIRAIDSAGKLPSWFIKYGLGAIITIAASVLLVFMMRQMVETAGGGIPSDQMNELLALEAPMSNFQKPYSKMVVNLAEEGETLEYHSGSKIIVPASAFVDEKGNAVKGKVDIEYREFNDHVDMFLAGVPKELDKHQNLQSVGMMEIKGFQDGKPVFLSMDKTLEVELKGKLASNIPTNGLGVYVYSKQQDAWDYSAEDRVEVIAASNTQPTPIDSEKNAEILAKAEASLASTKPIAPIAPGVPDNMQVFDFDINVSQFPELAAYDQKVELMVDKAAVNDGMFSQEWNSMEMTGLGNNKYELKLTREEDGGDVVKVLEVYPFVAATNDSERKYERDLVQYHEKLKAWESEVAIAAAEMQAKGDAVASVGWKEIVNRFSINRFGLWNCGKTVEMQEELQIDANFIDENGAELVVNKLFITNKNKQLYYFAPNAENSSKATLKYDAKAENLIWALTEDNELLVANTDKGLSDNNEYTFEMKAAGIVNSEEDIRNLLTF